MNDEISEFISRWKASGASERANFQSFIAELCLLIGVKKPEEASAYAENDSYIFERPVKFTHMDGTTSSGFIDLYKRGCFVMEGKQGSDQKLIEDAPIWSGEGSNVSKSSSKPKKGTAVRGTKGWNDAMIRARGQAESYAKALPISDGWPPFLIVVDVGHTIELYADFSLSGKNYSHFPGTSSFRILMDDLLDEKIRERLKLVWSDPLNLDPTKKSDKVTREIAEMLAVLAKSLEESGHSPVKVSDFLMRCLFTMFAEDVELIVKDGFQELMKRYRGRADQFHHMATALWKDMNTGSKFSATLETDIVKFNGGLFKNAHAIPLNEEQLGMLIHAAQFDWHDVEPAIFGTLLERALEPRERHKLGAHYTPRAYVERLLLPTVIEPLRHEWNNSKAAAVQLANAGQTDAAISEIRKFHQYLCAVTVLDPACGSGNFLYVTMEHMKRLEGEVLDLAHEMGEDQYFLEMDSHTVDPHQFLGMEINPRAVPITELVLWIGYLQWHFKTRGKVMPSAPVLKNFKNIENRDALIKYDKTEMVYDDQDKPLSRWDGRTTKFNLATGREVPDETARVEVLRYINPQPTQWPKADFIVGNPPFIGAKYIKDTMGEGYQEALWKAYKEKDVPRSADFVMYWWHKAADLVRTKSARRFGFITTNSITQTFSRRVVQRHLTDKKPISLIYAIADHPWVDATYDAAVRIAMTVGVPGKCLGRFCTVISDSKSVDGLGRDVELDISVGTIRPNLRLGVDVTDVRAIQANDSMAFNGVKLHGAGFIITPDQAEKLGLGTTMGLENHIRPYRHGRDITTKSRGVMVIDLFGLNSEEVRKAYPKVYQWVYDNVKPERDENSRQYRRENWWLFGENYPKARRALHGLNRYISSPVTSKHRFFIFMDKSILPDDGLINFAFEDAFYLGVLSSRAHLVWVLEKGGELGPTPRYIKTECFDTFSFPDCEDELKVTIREIAEELDVHRKTVQQDTPRITLTDMYNVLEKLRAGEPLDKKESDIHTTGLVSILKDLHEQLDVAVFAAYGWDVGLSDEGVLENLVALNHERAIEEKEGLIRWLRPAYQAPKETASRKEVQAELGVMAPVDDLKLVKQPWPKTLPDQVDIIRAILEQGGRSMTGKEISSAMKGARRDKVEEVLQTLVALSQIHNTGEDRYAA